jgi:hypothetical protein
MEFRLLTQTREEIDIAVLKGKLMSAGIMVRVDSKFTQPNKYSRPDLFGVYVPEDQWEEAKNLLSEFHPYTPKTASAWSRVHKGYIITFLVGFLGAAIWYVASIIQDIFNK